MVNIDEAYQNGDGGLGVIVRDWRGMVVCMAAAPFTTNTSAFHSEVMDVLWIESDFHELVMN